MEVENKWTFTEHLHYHFTKNLFSNHRRVNAYSLFLVCDTYHQVIIIEAGQKNASQSQSLHHNLPLLSGYKEAPSNLFNQDILLIWGSQNVSGGPMLSLANRIFLAKKKLASYHFFLFFLNLMLISDLENPQI